MGRRSRYAITKVSADLPAALVQQLDSWKEEIDGINRSQLISDLLRWALDHGAVDELYPECEFDHRHESVEPDCGCHCVTC